MTLWRKALVLIVLIAVILTAGGVSLYKLVIIPKYIEPVLVSASTLLRDPDIQDSIAEIAENLSDEGVVDSNTIKNYLRKAKKYTSSESSSNRRSSNNGSVISVNDITDEFENSDNDENDSSDKEDEKIVSSRTAQSSLGVKSVRSSSSSSKNTDDAKVNESYSKKFSSDNSSEDIDLNATDQYTFNAAEGEKLSDAASTAISNSRANSLYNKIINAMSLHERSVFFSVIAKADTDKLMEIYRNSDETAAKEYLHSILDNAEYSEAVGIFFKYAPLLIDD